MLAQWSDNEASILNDIGRTTLIFRICGVGLIGPLALIHVNARQR
jgi:hypothetical protein